MPFEVKIKERSERVEIIDQTGSVYKVRVGDKNYSIDVVRVENGVYSVIYKGKSTNMEMIEGDSPNKYIVNTRSNEYQIEMVDAKTRYKAANKSVIDNGDAIISSPMPGKVVRIAVKKGAKIAKGDTIIVVSAMKMESEYKSPIDGVVKKIFVKEDATIKGHQPLVEIEPLQAN